ncbi:MAG: YbaB/EbfC family nucleoid-associated protein [Chloroflexi bacterium]|nr:MAG: YbaB/EbfC family nucleoid-associated protein [Chloroflexota bacterium]RLC94972.1 MAG: YbaB/EbfC family nucleoid-associated protein [Chloroflexota bacterium]
MNKQIMRQVKELQAKLAKAHEELGNTQVEGSAGGRAVTVVVDGHQNVHSVKISPEAVDLDDISLLEDLVLTAVNEAIRKSQEMAQDRLGSLTGGLNIPGLM